MKAGLSARDWYDMDCLLAKANSIQLSKIYEKIEKRILGIRIALSKR